MTTDFATGKKVLFATFPSDGHFNPLTGLAMHLKQSGYDVRWYTSAFYSDKLKKLKIHHYPFQKAVEVHKNNFDEAFPERLKYKNQISRMQFDIINAFILRGPEYYADILNIYEEFPFDLVVADNTFPGIPFIKELMRLPLIAIGVIPLTQNSRDLPPPGLGITPSYSPFGKIKQTILRKLINRFVFHKPNKIMHDLLDQYGIRHNKENVFDSLIKFCDLLLQTGTPGLEYYRSDISQNIRFIGPLLPYQSEKDALQWFDNRLNKYRKIILVTQGTVEKDTKKLIVPTLEAFKNTDTLVVATTGGTDTQWLKEKYPHCNIIIEDFIPFGDIMPYADAFITNGGYGGVLLSIENRVPVIGAGIYEGKNEINARIDYFKYGINLKTETPGITQIRNAVNEVISNKLYRYNIDQLATEFSRYNAHQLFTKHVKELIGISLPKDEKKITNTNELKEAL